MMTKLSEIEALADAAMSNPGDESNDYFSPSISELRFSSRATPQTVKAMCALIKQQHEALLYTGAYAERGKALAAYEEFNK
jgi:hypothetical protein